MAIAFGSSASLSGLFSARPAPDAGQVGRFYFATDTNDLYRDSGTAWQHIGTARTYKAYTATIDQDQSNNPTATVLENTLGFTPTWTRQSQGEFFASSAGNFDTSKSWCASPAINPALVVDEFTAHFAVVDSDHATLLIFDNSGARVDSFTGLQIEIRVYP